MNGTATGVDNLVQAPCSASIGAAQSAACAQAAQASAASRPQPGKAPRTSKGAPSEVWSRKTSFTCTGSHPGMHELWRSHTAASLLESLAKARHRLFCGLARFQSCPA